MKDEGDTGAAGLQRPRRPPRAADGPCLPHVGKPGSKSTAAKAHAPPRRGRDRGDHLLHQHLESVGDDRRRAAGEKGGRAGARRAGLRQDEPGARLAGRHPLSRAGRLARPISKRSGSTSSATAARPASATAGRCRTPVADAVDENELVVAAVLSGNRNFEGRIHPQVRASFLASPPLVVAYALAGTVDIDLDRRSARLRSERRPGLSCTTSGRPRRRCRQTIADVGRPGDVLARNTATVFAGDERWQALPVPSGDLYEWDPNSTYVRSRPSSRTARRARRPLSDIAGARVLALLGDSVTTDHISPAGSIPTESPAGAIPDRARRAAVRVQLATARAAAITR